MSIQGDKAGAIAAYREELRLLREDWGIISGETYEAVERNIQKLDPRAYHMEDPQAFLRRDL